MFIQKIVMKILINKPTNNRNKQNKQNKPTNDDLYK